MKKILALLLTLCMLAALVACGAEPATTVPTDGTTTEPAASAESTADTTASTAAEKTPASYSVVTLKGPTGMGLASLMDKAAKGETTNTYSFTLAGDPTAVSASVIKGEVDVACVPVNLASVLYTKTNGAYVCAAVNTLGVLHILENGDSVQSIADLAGKTMMVQSTTKPEEIFLAGTDPRIPQFGELLSAEDRSVQYAMLNCGYVDAIAAHEAAILRYMQDCNANFRILEEPLLVTGIGVAFALNDTRGLDEKLTETFAAMRADGTMKQIVGKYLPDPEKYLEVDALEP